MINGTVAITELPIMFQALYTPAYSKGNLGKGFDSLTSVKIDRQL